MGERVNERVSREWWLEERERERFELLSCFGSFSCSFARFQGGLGCLLFCCVCSFCCFFVFCFFFGEGLRGKSGDGVRACDDFLQVINARAALAAPQQESAASRMSAKRKVAHSMPIAQQDQRPAGSAGTGGASVKKPRVKTVEEGAQVSVIIPAHNAMPWLEHCLESIAKQTCISGAANAPRIRLEISVYNDASTDNTAEKLVEWKKRFSDLGVRLLASSSQDWLSPSVELSTAQPEQADLNADSMAASSKSDTAAMPVAVGAGCAKNRAVHQSTGKWLCFLDADDVMYPDRIEKQFGWMQKHYVAEVNNLPLVYNTKSGYRGNIICAS